METAENWLFSESIQREMEFLRLCKLLHSAMKEKLNWSIRQMGVDLTSAQLDVLICIAGGCGKPVNQRDIEEQLRLSNPTVTGILKRLEKKGFITRTVGERDRRYKEVRLTEKCAVLGDRLHPSAKVLLHQLFAGFTLEEFDDLNRMMKRLVDNCSAGPRADPKKEQTKAVQGALPAPCPSGLAR